MKHKPLILVLILCFNHATAQDRAAWLKQARWGIMVHYLADWRARADSIATTPAVWNDMIDHFDVEGLAQQLKTAGAGYLIFTIGQNSGYFVAPNKTYERITGSTGKCSQRDLISDLSEALKKRNIKLIVYLPSGAPGGDSIARKALKWENGPNENHAFQQKKLGALRESTFFAADKTDIALFPLREYFRSGSGQASVKLRSSFGYPELGNVSKKVAKLILGDSLDDKLITMPNT